MGCGATGVAAVAASVVRAEASEGVAFSDATCLGCDAIVVVVVDEVVVASGLREAQESNFFEDICGLSLCRLPNKTRPGVALEVD